VINNPRGRHYWDNLGRVAYCPVWSSFFHTCQVRSLDLDRTSCRTHQLPGAEHYARENAI